MSSPPWRNDLYAAGPTYPESAAGFLTKAFRMYANPLIS
jgi:hypothetical protein